MKRHHQFLLAAATVLITAAIPAAQAATTSLTLGTQGRAIDNDGSAPDKGNGLGNSYNGGGAQAGAYNSGVDLVAVFSFQMSGVVPAEILSADFSSSLNVNALSDTSAFGLTASVIRTNAASGGLASDFQAAGTVLMTDFDGDATTDGIASLDASGQTILANWLQTNWVEDEWVFISLKPDNTNMFGSNNLYNFSDSTLVVTTVPEPSSAALLGLGGIALLMRRRK